jgi:hypothetical protein
MAYRISRNTEASIIDWLTEELSADNWIGIRVVKSFTQVYDGILPAICVQVVTPNPVKLEIGSPTWLQNIEVAIRIFAKDDGQRLDLSDWLLEKLENSIVYSQYTVTNGVASKEPKGLIQINTVIRDEKELTNTEGLEKEDKFRHIISFLCRVAE